MKIRSYGIADPINSRFTSHLSSRTQVEKVNFFIFDPRLLPICAIQSNVLGSLLFLLYGNDVFNVTRISVLSLFVDGNKIIHTFQPEALDSIVAEITQNIITYHLG